MTPTNDNNGFIILHRSILNWEWYDDVNTTRVFVHCLLRANHAPAKWHGIVIGRGSFVTSIAKLAKETRLSVRELRTALEHLKTTQELTHKTTHRYSIITITNYALYQDKKNVTDTLNDKRPPADDDMHKQPDFRAVQGEIRRAHSRPPAGNVQHDRLRRKLQIIQKIITH